MPSTPTTVDGAVKVCPSSLSCSPAGVVVKVIVVVRGNTSRMASFVRPAESMTDRWMRYQTLAAVSPRVGTTKEPPVTPLVGGRTGWVCVSWWKFTHHVSELAGSVPSSGSEPEPE